MARIEEWKCYLFGHEWVEKTNHHYHYIAQVCQRCGETSWGGQYSTSEGIVLPQECLNKKDQVQVTYKVYYNCP